ncbi:MAG: sulfur carrier protein ThiS [Bacteroidaceae bacterium]|nr:sulfur carrier protein ThiS [Bacteroidaceae bacterium]
MKVIINNKTTETSAKTLFVLAEEMELPQKGVAVAVDNKMIPRAEWESTVLSENMNIVIIKAACGG